MPRCVVSRSDVARELVHAVQAVLEGKQFISASLHDRVLADVEDSHATEQDHSDEDFQALPRETLGVRHELKVYFDDAAFVAGVAGVAEGAIKVGGAVVMVATQSHQAGVFRDLEARGIDPSCGHSEGQPPLPGCRPGT